MLWWGYVSRNTLATRMYHFFAAPIARFLFSTNINSVGTQLSPDWTYTTEFISESATDGILHGSAHNRLFQLFCGKRLCMSANFTVYPHGLSSNKIRPCGRTRLATVWPLRALTKTSGKFGWRCEWSKGLVNIAEFLPNGTRYPSKTPRSNGLFVKIFGHQFRWWIGGSNNTLKRMPWKRIVRWALRLPFWDLQ